LPLAPAGKLLSIAVPRTEGTWGNDKDVGIRIYQGYLSMIDEGAAGNSKKSGVQKEAYATEEQNKRKIT
jgi:hypothetical protein